MSRFQPMLPNDLRDALFGDVDAQTWLELLGERAGIAGHDGATIVMDGRYLLLRVETLSSLSKAPVGTTLLDPKGRVIACVSSDGSLTPGSPTRVISDDEESRCANSPWEVAQMARIASKRRLETLINSGVRFVDPERVLVGAKVTIQTGATIFPDVALLGDCDIHEGAVIRERVSLTDTVVGEAAVVLPGTVATQANIGPHCSVGPMAHLRPGTNLLSANKVGNFVETKNATLAHGAKASHLSYLGDAEVGEHANIGAGTITCNYDGWSKHRTEIGDHAFIGSNTALVAPVTVGANSIVGAGSVITASVEEGALALTRSKQQQLKHAAKRIHERNRKHAQREQDKGANDE